MSYDNLRRDQQTATATIANGASLSGAVDIGGARLVALQIPPAWTAANITFTASTTLAGTYGPVRDVAGAELTLTGFAVNEVVYLSPAQTLGLRYIKVRSGTAALPVNQLGDRVLTLIVRPT
jgi:hypothetical protein